MLLLRLTYKKLIFLIYLKLVFKYLMFLGLKMQNLEERETTESLLIFSYINYTYNNGAI
jgi:hypothetical protein